MLETPYPYPPTLDNPAPKRGICRHCKKEKKFHRKTKQLCNSCSDKHPENHWMKSCEVPACPVIFDGTTACAPREGKTICGSCSNTRRVYHSEKTWEEFCEIRASWFARPTNFANTQLEEINMKWTLGTKTGGEKAECQCCKKEKPIYNYKYQLCMSCMTKEQYRGETCSCCGYVADGTLGMVFRKKDSAPTCINCSQRLVSFNMTIEQYQQYVVALDNQPSEYYVFLRVVVFIASIWNIKEYYFNSKNDDFAMVVVICSAITLVLFNPIVPIYFWDKTEWIFPDILASIFFLVVAFQDYKIKDSNSANREAQDKNFKSQKVFHDANFSCDCGALNNKRNVGVTCGKCKSKVIAVT